MVEYYKEKLNVALTTLALVEDGAYRMCEKIGKDLCLATEKKDIVVARDALDSLLEALSNARDEVEDLENRLAEEIEKRETKS